MLIQLKLKNVALIEIIEINFEKGLNIFTGDSGSGKSLILDSLNVLFGGTNIPLNHLIRPGKNDCLIEAKFYSSNRIEKFLNQNGFLETSPELKIKRISYKKNNKILSKFTVNDLSINKKLLEQLSFYLIDFAGQSDTFLFNSQEYRKSIIDELGTDELRKINLEVKKIWNNLEKLKASKIEKTELFEKQKENNKAFKQMFNILDQADLSSSEEIQDLQSLENKLANNFQIKSSIKEILNNLNNCSQDKPSVDFLITDSIKHIKKISNFDRTIQQFTQKLISFQIDVEDFILDLKSYIQQADNCDTSLEEVQKRLFFLRNLERTFCLELPQLIKKREELKKSLLSDNYDDHIKVLEEQINHLETNLNSLFISQSSYRKQIAKDLESAVMILLKNLGLENAKFLIVFDQVNASSEGIDNINFLFSANPDQQLAPLSKVISGGEMSRFLFAFKSSITKKPNTFFLDEIDNGLSGKSLFSLVNLIKKFSQEKQVLCITHQPFLAASGSVHFKVSKNVIDGFTFTSISKLKTKKERQKELIELIGGGFGEADNYASTLLERAAA